MKMLVMLCARVVVVALGSLLCASKTSISRFGRPRGYLWNILAVYVIAVAPKGWTLIFGSR